MVERVTNLLQRIPGYSGYRDKERRRDEDKRIREEAARDLTVVVDQLTAANAALVAQRDLKNVSTVEAIISKTRLLSDRIRTASYGYAGLFADRPIDEFALDQLARFDQAIAKRVEQLAGDAAAVASAPDGAQQISTEVDQIATLFEGRTAVIETARPVTEKKILDLLDTTEPPKPSPFTTITRGDAFSVLGDNHTATATVTITDGATTIQVIRTGDTDGDQEIWFVGASTPDVRPARLLTTEDGSAFALASVRTAPARIESEIGKQEKVSAGYAFAYDDTSGKVSFLLQTAGTTRYFTGSPVNDFDIEVYGSTR